MTTLSNNKIAIAVIAAFVFLTLPIFFEIYRVMAFDVVPRDDYAPYLLYLLGQEGGELASSPRGYRIFSVIIAAPFYYAMPLFSFSRLGQIDPEYLKATQAMAMVSYLSILGTSVVTYAIARFRLGASHLSAVLVGLIALLLLGYTSRFGVDPLGIMIISLLILFIRSYAIFTLLILLSVGINEKIAFLFVMLFVSRAIFQKSLKHNMLLIPSLVATIGYLALRSLVDLPGADHQTDPSAFVSAFTHTLGLTLSVKGAYMSIVPIGLMALMYVLASRYYSQDTGTSQYFSKADVLPLIGFVILAMIVDVEFNVGRIALYAFPLYLPLMSLVIDGLQSETVKVPQMKVEETNDSFTNDSPTELVGEGIRT